MSLKILDRILDHCLLIALFRSKILIKIQLQFKNFKYLHTYLQKNSTEIEILSDFDVYELSGK